MPDSLADLQAQLAAIDTQIAQPEFVQFGDRSTRYRPIADLLKARETVLGRMAALQAKPRQYVARSSKGFGVGL